MFWSKVAKSPEPDGCWLWTGARYGSYGLAYASGATPAHRVAYELEHGEVTDDLLVCHKCDVPLCVRPSHLFLGTHADNVQDRVNKGRSAVGVRNGRAVLCEEAVRKIRAAVEAGATSTAQAKKYGVDVKTILKIVKGITWRHVPA